MTLSCKQTNSFRIKTLNGVCLLCDIRPVIKDDLIIIDKLKFRMGEIKHIARKNGFVWIELFHTTQQSESCPVSRKRLREDIIDSVENIIWE